MTTQNPDPALSAAPTRFARLSEACVFGSCVAALAAVPTALRTTAHGGGFFDGLLIGVATLLPLVTLSIVMLRAAGRGLRGIAGKAKSHVVVLRIALWIGIALPALSVLATLLKAVTHHRGLGGATFGVFGLAAALGAALLAYRLVDLGEMLAARGVKSWVLAASGAVIGVVPLLLVASPLGRPAAHNGAGAAGAAIVDGLIAVIALALVATFELGGRLRKFVDLLGVPFAAVLVITAAGRVEASKGVGRAVQVGGGLPATLLHGLESWTDRDGDGEGSHFGGGDCDEGNSARNTRAEEVPGDGIDQNCDGVDTPLASAQTALSAAPTASSSTANSANGAHSGNAVQPQKAAAQGRFDIVFVTLDSVRADHTSAYGYEKPTTKRLADLASRGVLFEKAYAAASDTQRAYTPLVTGRRYAKSARDKREWPTLLSDNDTLAERLHRSGYVTAAVTSFTWLSDERGFDQGFDRFETVYKDAHPEKGVTGPLAVRAARKILADTADRAQPVFLWVHLFDAHEKYIDHKGFDFGKGRTGAYDGEVAFVDEQVGVILDTIAKGPRAQKTIVAICGTNGEGLDEHEFTGHSGELYEEVLRVPMIVFIPGAAPAKVSTPVSTIDLVATLLELGSAPTEGLDGKSLVPLLRGGQMSVGPVLVRSKKGVALMDGSLKLMVIERKKGKQVLLFDLATDPAEKKDIAADRASEVERLSKVLSELDG